MQVKLCSAHCEEKVRKRRTRRFPAGIQDWLWVGEQKRVTHVNLNSCGSGGGWRGHRRQKTAIKKDYIQGRTLKHPNNGRKFSFSKSLQKIKSSMS